MELELHDLLMAEFEEDGTGPNYNCWNLCREIYRRAGRILPLYSEYISNISQRDALINKLKNSNEFINLTIPEYLAIVTLRLSAINPKKITHLGIVINKRQFIHITRKTGVSIERIDIGRCTRKIEGFYRYAGSNHTK